MNWLKPDLSKPTCRVCLKNKIDGEICSIFDMDAELYNLRIYEKIERCAGIKISCDTKFPTFICCHCNEFLRISYKFRTTCQNSEEYLKIVAETEANQRKKETLVTRNDLCKAENTSNENSSGVYKRDDSFSPLCESLEKYENIYCSPAHYEEEATQEFLTDNETDLWVDIDYSDGDDILSVEIDETYTDKNPLKIKKRPYVKQKKSNSILFKTIEIASDGAAIIKERKPRAKREDIKQPHVCEICGNVYKRRHILEHHIKRHSNEKDFECEICGYAFHSNFELRRHMRKHTGSRPYKCSYCPSAFGDHSTLTKHERVHRNERPFKCDICGSSFSYPAVLKRHKLVHTGEKPYKCELCGKCFNDRYHLQSHLKTIQHKNDPRVELLIQNIKENNV